MTNKTTSTDSIQSRNFWHLYWDIIWFGLAFGSTISFLSVFATRLGALGWQLGLLSAGPALISIIFTLPAGRWLEHRPLGPAVTTASVWHRVGFFVLVPLPLLLPTPWQIWAIIAITLYMGLPGTVLAIGFNALLATTVPIEFRGKVVGRRNALLAGSIMVSFLVSGWILDQLPFEWGYVVVFGLGAIGSGMSSYHLYCIKVPETPSAFQYRPVQDQAQPGKTIGNIGVFPQRLAIGLRLWLQWRPVPQAFQHVSHPYRWMMGAYFAFHFAQMLPTALFPIFWVREADLSDNEIAWINAVFFLSMLAAASFLGPLSRRYGNYHLNIVGAILLGVYPLLTAVSQGVFLLLVASVIGGAVWAVLSGSLANRLFEVIPEDQRPLHLAIYNLSLNVAVLSGTMLGPFFADVIGLREALFVVFVLRVGSGFTLARWG